MDSSKIVEIDGIFVGAAVRLPQSQGWRFVSTDDRAREADGRVCDTLQAAKMLARQAFARSVVKPRSIVKPSSIVKH